MKNSESQKQQHIDAAQRRQARQAFIARGRASLARARETGEYVAATDALTAMKERLDTRVAQLRQRQCS
jgi:hypothetical protein